MAGVLFMGVSSGEGTHMPLGNEWAPGELNADSLSGHRSPQGDRCRHYRRLPARAHDAGQCRTTAILQHLGRVQEPPRQPPSRPSMLRSQRSISSTPRISRCHQKTTPFHDHHHDVDHDDDRQVVARPPTMTRSASAHRGPDGGGEGAAPWGPRDGEHHRDVHVRVDDDPPLHPSAHASCDQRRIPFRASLTRWAS